MARGKDIFCTNYAYHCGYTRLIKMSLEETTARRHSPGCHLKIKFTQFLLRCAFFYLHKWLRGKTPYQHCLALSIERNASTPSLFLYTKYTLHCIHNNISVCTVSNQVHINICVNKLKTFLPSGSPDCLFLLWWTLPLSFVPVHNALFCFQAPRVPSRLRAWQPTLFLPANSSKINKLFVQ